MISTSKRWKHQQHAGTLRRSVCWTDKKIRLTNIIDNVTGNNNPHLCFRTIFFLCGSCMRLRVRVGLDLSCIVTSGSFNIDHQSHAAFCKHEPAVYNLLGSHYLIRGHREFFFFFFSQSSSSDPPPCNITSCSFNICLEKRLNCSAQTHTDTRMEFTQRNEAVRSYWKQTTTTGDGEERERHTDRGFTRFFFVVFFFFASSTASLSLPSPCWAWQLSAGSRSICLSLQLSDTQSTWFPMP